MLGGTGLIARRDLAGEGRANGHGADGLKQALALLWERRADCPNAVPVIACHDDTVVECDAGQENAVAAWLRHAMVDRMAH